MDEKNEKSESKGNNSKNNIEQAKCNNNNNNNNNNNSELSNSSSISNSSNPENNETLQDLNCNEKMQNSKRCKTNKEDGGNIEKLNNTNAEKEQKEGSTLLANVKKEENSLSPMSPACFDSITNTEINSVQTTVTAKINEHARLNEMPKINSHEKSLSSPSGNSISCKEEINSAINVAPNSASLNNAMLQSSFGTSGAVSNCLDYMQQQNHIFVFSTQLANKGAESVMSGQFQTIIAYHCTQPSTKNFLEDFFIKNPMKMSKLPRNMLNIGATHGNNSNNNNNNSQWAGGGNGSSNAGNICSNMSKGATKSVNKAMNFNLLNTNVETHKPAIGKTVTTSSANAPGFLDGNDNESDLIHHCWENNHRSDGKIGDKNSMDHASSHSSKNSTHNETTKLMTGNDQIPSLQGVKVPDENLTPQQRQHREEQLAKLKKIDKILFPENDAATQGHSTTQPINKISNDNPSAHQSGMNNLIMNLGSGTPTSGLPQVRNNIIQGQKLSSDSDPGMSGLGGASEQLHTENMVKAANINCEPMNSNVLSMNMQTSNMLMPSIAETTLGAGNGAFNCGNGNLNSGDEKIVGNAAQDIGALDWPKLQNQYLDERLKGNKPLNEVGLNRLNLNSNPLCGNVRSNPNPSSSNPAGGNVQRGGQGPPPPYHSTQRSASVPIATQSPNPSSPNNPTSNLSLPSPSAGAGATSVAALTANSPNVDMGNAPGGVPCSSANTGLSNQINKGAFSNEGTSPLNNNNTNRNRNSQQGQLNSNPSTPLSHMSPKDMESFNANNISDHQQNSIDGRFPTSPGFNFPPHIQNASGNVNNFKAQLDRPVTSSSFGRRTENIPLNPNSGRTPQNKLGSVPFDPISSLAQMSQQLTSCVPSSVGNTNVGCNELNLHANMDGMMQNMDSNVIEGSNLMQQTGGSMSGASGVFGQNNCNVNALMMGPMNPQHRLLNPKLCGNGPSGFNSPGNNNNQGNFHGVLPPPTNHSHHHQQHRLRMPGMNFNNFNVSPNIQVKASTPNTIQYMPVRPQNNNNMRAPPSLDFLQRYANPSQMDSHVGPGGGGHLSQMNTGGMAPDSNKLVNSGASGICGSPSMSFFQHCNQIDPDDIVSGNGMLPTSSHDVNVNMIRGIRPMRQNNMVSHGVGNMPQRMMAPNNSGSAMPLYPGASSHPPTQDSLDCGDISNFFGASGGGGGGGNNPSNNPNQLYHMGGGGSHKTGKAGGGMLSGVGGGMCSNINANNGAGHLPHDQHNGMVSQGMLGPTMMSNSTNSNGPQLPIVAPGPNTNNMNYKPFVGPASNDLKYAQQYHSFQQQLYATSTRSQHQNGNNIASVVQNSNSPFFVNK